MQDRIISFIGCGNMGLSLIGGLIADGHPAENLRAMDKEPAQLDRLHRLFPVRGTDRLEEAVAEADVVVLAVKPQGLKALCLELAPLLPGPGPLILSVAAGIPTGALQRWLGEERAVVRAMPNTPALVGSGASALYATAQVSEEQRILAENILRAVGLVIWLEEEEQMDAVTALSGSGPAYLFLVIEAMEAAGRELGLEPQQARLLSLQTAYGAAKMALESELDPATLRQQVTSPGGTTERALEVLESGGLRSLFLNALTAARDRSRELAQTLGSE
ncbi:MAG: pyrroline-5-carboxylate reductase [Gammaproteobacteria bacterium]|nr:MAG: pyrroline-5-carboxylate reductase [Gammaproteobacteria bacterium]